MVVRYDGPACSLCAAPLVALEAHVCGQCMIAPPRYHRAFSYGLYVGALREAIHLIKFKGLKRLAGPVSALMTHMALPEVDFVVPVPLSHETLKERGFNQSLLIGKTVAGHINVPIRDDVLRKTRHTLMQSSLGMLERRENVKGAYAVEGALEGARVLLVDDVVTTGATVSECTKVLMKAGAGRVYVASPARTSRMHF